MQLMYICIWHVYITRVRVYVHMHFMYCSFSGFCIRVKRYLLQYWHTYFPLDRQLVLCARGWHETDRHLTQYCHDYVNYKCSIDTSATQRETRKVWVSSYGIPSIQPRFKREIREIRAWKSSYFHHHLTPLSSCCILLYTRMCRELARVMAIFWTSWLVATNMTPFAMTFQIGYIRIYQVLSACKTRLAPHNLPVYYEYVNSLD